MLSFKFETKDNTLTVKLDGKLNTTTSSTLEKELQNHVNNVTDIIMDFAKVSYISSSGIRVLLATEQHMANQGGSFKIIHVNDDIMEIFELVGFMDMVQVESD